MLVVQASSPVWPGAGQRPAPQYENGQLSDARLLSTRAPSAADRSCRSDARLRARRRVEPFP